MFACVTPRLEVCQGSQDPQTLIGLWMVSLLALKNIHMFPESTSCSIPASATGEHDESLPYSGTVQSRGNPATVFAVLCNHLRPFITDHEFARITIAWPGMWYRFRHAVLELGDDLRQQQEWELDLLQEEADNQQEADLMENWMASEFAGGYDSDGHYIFSD